MSVLEEFSKLREWILEEQEKLLTNVVVSGKYTRDLLLKKGAIRNEKVCW
jgi:hypothetical protein